MEAKSRAMRKVEEWKLKLIDLSRRNRLVYFSPTKSSNLQISSPDMKTIFERLMKGRSWEIWQSLEAKYDLKTGTVSSIAPQKPPSKTQLVPSEVDALQLQHTLRNLLRRSVSEYRERGVRILYITFGMLNWREAETNEAVRSPIVLMPLELTKERPHEPYSIRIPEVEEEAILNPALRLKIKNDYKIELPQAPDFEERSLQEYLEDVAAAGGSLDWFVEPIVQIGLFSFYKLVMYQDLIENADKIVSHPIISALAGEPQGSMLKSPLPREADLDTIVDPKRTFQVLDADSSQQLCIQYALRGQSFVMHGPPGTGKSQTIANIISEFIAAGKSALFVSEKMAALEVVYNRLRDRGLDDFCLELHSQKANKREVVAELSRALTEHLKPRRSISDAELERLKTRRDQLNSYVNALHFRRAPMDVSAFELLGRLAKLENMPFIASDYSHFDSLNPKRFFELEELIRRLINVWSVVEEGEGFPWRGCRDTSFIAETRSEWIALIDGTCSAIQELEGESERYTGALGLPHPRKLADLEWLKEVASLIRVTPRPPSSWFGKVDLNEAEREAEKNRKEYAEYWSSRHSLEKSYDAHFFKLPLGTSAGVGSAWAHVREVLATIRDGDGGLLELMREVTAYAERLPVRIQEWKEAGANLSRIFGLPEKVDSLSRIQQLAELASLCDDENRPEAAWLNAKTLRETREIFEEAKRNYGRRDELRGRLLKDYSEGFLRLDLDGLIDWFEGPGRSAFRYFRPRYYSVKGLLSSVSRTGEVPESALDDLKVARELLSLEERIASRSEAVKRSLKSYYREGAPDFESAEKALRNAERTLKIIKASRAPDGVANNLSVGSRPVEELFRSGRYLRESLAEWRAETNRLKRLIPMRRLPNTERTLMSSPLEGVSEWATDAAERLASLSGVSAEALSTRISEHPFSFVDLISDLKKAEYLQKFEISVTERWKEERASFGERFTGLTTDWDAILRSVDWTRRLRRLLREGASPALIAAVSEGGSAPPGDPEIGSKLEKAYAGLNGINERFEKPQWKEPKQILELDDIKKRLDELRSRVDELQVWVDFKNLEAKLNDSGLGSFTARLQKDMIDRDQILPVFHKSMYQGLVDQIFRQEPVLGEFRGQDHEQLIAEFQDLDRRFIQLSAYRVIQRANEQKPQGVFIQAPDSEITILQREAAKKRRYMPIRDLFDRIPNLLGRLKPCLLMSPITVSQFLIPGRLKFDLVVFDEASQIYTEDAVGAIYRGDQLVVAGDNKQLPPTPFFRYALDEDFDWDEVSDYEFDVFDSVLDECMSIGLPLNMLRWHYRSKHDSLINFSNDRFYDGRLVLFPSALKADEDLGLKFIHVPDGVYDRGGARNNVREAEVVADLVFDHFARHPGKSLGVVTFSLSQMNTVQDAIERRLTDHQEYERFFVEDRLQGFFVKNLENVQGDERDVMIISVGYGYDREGRITMNFGPVNKPGGERRLNVAITRAREKVIIVSSIRARDFDLGATQAPGAHSLYQYLMYAERGPEALVYTGARGEEHVSDIEQDVLMEVRRLGYEAVPRVGSGSFRVDLSITDPDDPERFVLGILCDGESYRSAAMARDRDRLRQEVLEGLGWRTHRVWSPDWVQRRETELKRLKEALEEAESRPRKRRSSTASGHAPGQRVENRVERVEVVETTSGFLPGVEAYTVARLRPRRDFSRFSPGSRGRHLFEYASEVRYLLPTLVREEGPISRERAYRRINSSLGLSHASPAFDKAFADALSGCVRRGLFSVKGEFLWPRRVVALRVRVPVDGVDETFRPLRDISREELIAAMSLIAGHSISLSVESMVNETARLFGFRRMGDGVRKAMAEALEFAVREGALTVVDGFVGGRDGR